MKNLISVIIPCYNDELFLEGAIDSILKQTIVNKLEIILVDDGSNIKTKELIKKIASKIDLLITQENQGQATARNNGIKKANGDYILVLDSDDFFESPFCEKAINVIQSDSDIKIVTSYTNILYEGSSTIKLYKPLGGNLLAMLLNNTAMGSCMFKKEDWELVGGYDETMRNGFEDWEFYIRLLKNKGNVKVIEDVLFNYRRKKNSTTFEANKIKYDLLRYIYCKHQELYKMYFTDFIDFLLNKIEIEEKEKIKKYSKIEYKIGLKILKPLRFIKRIFNA